MAQEKDTVLSLGPIWTISPSLGYKREATASPEITFIELIFHPHGIRCSAEKIFPNPRPRKTSRRDNVLPTSQAAPTVGETGAVGVSSTSKSASEEGRAFKDEEVQKQTDQNPAGFGSSTKVGGEGAFKFSGFKWNWLGSPSC